jgi:hypothetical protein
MVGRLELIVKLVVVGEAKRGLGVRGMECGLRNLLRLCSL